MVLFSDFASSGRLDLPETGGSLEVQFDVILSSGALSSISLLVAEPLQEQPRVPRSAVVGGSSTSAC